MVKCVQLVGRLRDRATALSGGKIRIVVATLQLFFFSAGRAISKVRGCSEEGHPGDDRGVGELGLGEGQGRERSRNRLTILKTQVPSTHGNHLHCLAGTLRTSYLSIPGFF